MSERLTKRFNGGYGLVNVKEDEQDVESKFPNTLQAILDSFDWLGRIEDVLFDADGNEVISLDRLRELAEAERDGRVVVLPVAIGTPVYVMFYFPPAMYLGGMTVEFMGEPIEEHAFDMDMLESWGETIFATRAEAERALAEKGDAI